MRAAAAGLLCSLSLAASRPASPPCDAFNALYAQIRDRRIDRAAALARVRELLPAIEQEFRARGGGDTPGGAERFPVQGYGAESIGGTNGSGYNAKGYDWFDGYASKGHPGHDIF